MFTEQSLLLGPGRNLVATITRPAAGTDSQGMPVALLTNSGVISRSGPHRVNVQIARRLAQRGITSIRFDLSGIGDSRRMGAASSQMEQWAIDARAIMDHAEEHLNCRKFFMVGFCSGAEVAYRCALLDSRLQGILLWDLFAYPTLRSRWNTLCFRLRRAGVGGIIRKGMNRLRVSLGLGQTTQPQQRQLQDLEPPKVPSLTEFALNVEVLMKRGVEVFVMYCGGEPQWYNYPNQLRDSLSAYPVARTVRCEQLYQSDHVLTLGSSRAAFIQRLERWLDETLLSATST